MHNIARPAEALAAVEKAMRLDPRNHDRYLSQLLAVHPDIYWAHLDLAIADIELGHDDAARAEAAEVLRLNPQFILEMVCRTVGPKGKVLAENVRFSADLRKAGLK